MIAESCMRRLWLMILLLAAGAAAHADTFHDARDIARAHGLTYKDLSGGAVHAAKLSGKDIEIVFFADLSSIMINHETVIIARPVRWENDALQVPSEGAEVIAQKLGGGSGASTVPVAAVSPAKATRNYKVVIDAGHGGKDPGAISASGLQEKQINLDMAKRVGNYLKARGVTIIFTRTTDTFVELDNRVAITNRAKPDLFVSIHANADNRKDLRGASTYYPDDGPNDGRPGILGRARDAYQQVKADTFGAGGPVNSSALLPIVSTAFESYRIQSKDAATLIQRQLIPITGEYYRDRGIVEDFIGYRVLRGVQAPAVLVETDFLSNRTSAARLATAEYRARIAEGIGKAVMEFLEKAD